MIMEIVATISIIGLLIVTVALEVAMLSWMIWGPIAAFKAHRAILAARERGEGTRFLKIEQRACINILSKGSQYAELERFMGVIAGFGGLFAASLTLIMIVAELSLLATIPF